MSNPLLTLLLQATTIVTIAVEVVKVATIEVAAAVTKATVAVAVETVETAITILLTVVAASGKTEIETGAETTIEEGLYLFVRHSLYEISSLEYLFFKPFQEFCIITTYLIERMG